MLERKVNVPMELWLSFVLAATLILVIPGPTIILVVSRAISHGRKSAFPLVTGVVLGDFTAMTLSLLGLGALMAASAFLFSVFKWIGAAYLVFLGARLLRSSPVKHPSQRAAAGSSPRPLFKSAFIVTALNPKSIAFFVAFLPQFVDPLRPPLPQFMLLAGTFLVIAAINAALYALFAGQLREYVRQERVLRRLNWCGGSALIGAGILTAGLRRTS